MASSYQYKETDTAKAAQEAQATQNAAIQAASAQQSKTSAINPSGITQSYYTTPVTEQNYLTATRPTYTQSDAVKAAAEALEQHQAAKPGEYQSNYNGQIQELLNNLLNRKDFSYDFATDPMYQQYAEKYQQQGQQAMKSAIGEAASLTGGYGNSYAQSVGQQTYQQYLQNLNDIIPTLRDSAYQRYQDQGDTMRSNLGMLQTQDAADYSKYRDTVTDWKDELSYLYSASSDMSQQEYNRYLNDAGAWESDRAYWYQKAYDDQQQANWQAQFNAMYGGRSSSGGGGRSGSSGNVTLKSTTQQGAAKELANLVNQGKISSTQAATIAANEIATKKKASSPGNKTASGFSGYTR